MLRSWGCVFALVSGLGLLAACDSDSSSASNTPTAATVDEERVELTATVGPAGGIVEAPNSASFAGFGLAIPEGALPSATKIVVRRVQDDTELPEGAIRVGVHFTVDAGGAVPQKPFTVRLPVDVGTRTEFGGDPGDVKVWVREDAGWSLVEPAGTAPDRVFIQMSRFTTMAAGIRLTLKLNQALTCGSAALPACGSVTVLEPLVGQPPQPCTIQGGFCVEALTGGSSTAPVPDKNGAFVRDGRVMYRDKADAQHVIQLRLSDLAVAHARGTVDFSGRARTTTTGLGRLFFGTTLFTFSALEATPLATTQLFVSGDLLPSQNWFHVSAETARGVAFAPSGISMRNVDTSNKREAAINLPVAGAVLAGADPGTPGGFWFVEPLPPVNTVGASAGVLRRVGPNGVTQSISDLPQPGLFFGACAGGTGGFGDTLSCGSSAANVFFADANKLIVSVFDASGNQSLAVADLAAGASTLSPLTIPPPTTGSGASFRNVAIDAGGKIWFTFGSGASSSTALYRFDPATNVTVQVPIADHGPIRIFRDGTSIVVFALKTDNQRGGLFRVRAFE